MFKLWIFKFRKSWRSPLLLCILIACSSFRIKASKNRINNIKITEEILAGDKIKKLESIHLHLVFPYNLDKKFIPGEPVNVLVLVQNENDVTDDENNQIIVHSLEASTRLCQQWDFYIENYTEMKYQQVVPPQSEASFDYYFIPHESFDQREFGLSIMVHYEHKTLKYVDAVYNSTFQIFEPEEEIDNFREVFFLCIGLCIVALISVGIQSLVRLIPRPKVKKWKVS